MRAQEKRIEDDLFNQTEHKKHTSRERVGAKIEDQVFDKNTLMALYALANQGYIEKIGGPIATGKEACVFEALGDTGKLAVKLYLVENSNYRKMRDYLQGDPRFAQIKNTKQSIVYAFAQKEFRNLQKAQEAGVHVPKPIACKKNVLITRYLGDEAPAPRLKDVEPEKAELEKIYESVAEDMKKLYGAGLVHGDLSEYNILVAEGPYLIDFSQAVLIQHPEAEAYLKRDVHNVTKYFGKRVKVRSEEELLKFVKEK